MPKGALAAYSSAGAIYSALLPPDGHATKIPDKQWPYPITVDVRDVAQAHVLALTAPLSSEPGVGRKRLLVVGAYFTWKDAVLHLYAARPELKNRLPDVSEAKGSDELTIARSDVSKAAEILGLKEYIDWRKTVEDSIDSFLEIEKRGD